MTTEERQARFQKRVKEESVRRPTQAKMADEIVQLKKRIKALEEGK